VKKYTAWVLSFALLTGNAVCVLAHPKQAFAQAAPSPEATNPPAQQQPEQGEAKKHERKHRRHHGRRHKREHREHKEDQQ